FHDIQTLPGTCSVVAVPTQKHSVPMLVGTHSPVASGGCGAPHAGPGNAIKLATTKNAQPTAPATMRLNPTLPLRTLECLSQIRPRPARPFCDSPPTCPAAQEALPQTQRRPTPERSRLGGPGPRAAEPSARSAGRPPCSGAAPPPAARAPPAGRSTPPA